jgi:hypothetical protein
MRPYAKYCSARWKSHAHRKTDPTTFRRPRWISAVRVSDNPADPVEIELSQEKWAMVDLADLGLVIHDCWVFSQSGASGYAIRPGPRPKRRPVLMHRVILGLADDDPHQADHINHDTLDNRRANLRIATRTQNLANSRKQDRASSRYKGVVRAARGWQAYLTNNRKRQYLGYFDTEEEAALAYNWAAVAAWGEFARLNVIPTAY